MILTGAIVTRVVITAAIVLIFAIAIRASLKPKIICEPEVYGDGAWNPPLDLERLQQQRPRTARIRDMETRRGY